ncbi:MAG TPA: chemotaxis protein CheW, partial [Vicinamibacteria bacterium]
MGRMADARKRAKRGKGGEGAGEGAPAPGAESAPAAPAGPTEPEAPSPPPASRTWVAQEEPLVIGGPPASAAAEAAERAAEPAGATGRLSLPSSGLAADILALAETATVPAAAPAPLEPVALTPAPAEAPRAHNLSFFATPVREERKVAEATEHLATFFLAREEYGVDVRLVQEIIRVSEITTVPRAPGFIKGVINLRGRIIPVVDLKRKLGLGEVDEKERAARIVVVKVRERLVGLLVDGASQVLKVPV